MATVCSQTDPQTVATVITAAPGGRWDQPLQLNPSDTDRREDNWHQFRFKRRHFILIWGQLIGTTPDTQPTVLPQCRERQNNMSPYAIKTQRMGRYALSRGTIFSIPLLPIMFIVHSVFRISVECWHRGVQATCIKWGLKDQDLHFSVNIWSSDSRSKVGLVNIGMSVSTWGEKWDMSGSISSGSARQDRICRGQLRDTSQQCDECFNVSCFGPFLARQNEISLGLIQSAYHTQKFFSS